MHADSNTLGILHSLQEHSLIVRALFSSWAKGRNFVTLNCIGSFETLTINFASRNLSSSTHEVFFWKILFS